ncbi:MAG: Gfo/Idh/MocA family oxidoreductase [Deltaproteobacteria bacterium]|nr:Gfo/Idh/MocA family oxidoreductase [Deltaproteobacteria bacterium]
MSDKILNIGVVGCGYWGPNLIRNFHSQEGCRVKTICDLDENRLAHLANLYPGVGTTTDLDEVVNDPEIDAVAVATAVDLHFPLARRSLLAGKHTFVEKPMTSSSAHSRELVDLADSRGLTLMTGHTFIYSAPVRRIKEIVDSGELGEIYYISSRRLNLGLFQKDINVTWDLAPHDISIILYVFGSPPLSVNCQGRAHINPGIEDVTNLSLNFENGGFATIHSSWLDPNKVREMVFVGSKKMLIYDDTEPLEKIKIYDKRVEAPPHYDDFAGFQYAYHYGDMLAPYIQQTEPLKVETRHFLDCIETGETPMSSGRDGHYVVQILEAASRSLKENGAAVDINGKADFSAAK